MSFKSGRHFLQIPGPTNVPERVLRALSQPTIDHRGPEFARLTREVQDGLKPIFKTSGPIAIYPASGTGAWEAALVNTLSPGDRVLSVRNRILRHSLARPGRHGWVSRSNSFPETGDMGSIRQSSRPGWRKIAGTR